MDAHRRPPPKEALSNERARELALAEVLRMEDAKRETQVWNPPRQTTGRMIVLACLLFGVSVWLWVWPPAPLSLDVPELRAGSPERIEAGLRVAIGLQVDRIEAFRVENGRLPDALTQVGEPLPGITYTRRNSREYSIRARSEGRVVSFESGDSLDVFMRSALRTLRESNE